MTGEHRNPHAGTRHEQIGKPEDFAALVAEFLLLVGLIESVIDDLAGKGKHVERNRLHEVLTPLEGNRAAVVGEVGTVDPDFLRLVVELTHTGEPGARHRLVGRHHHRFQAGLVGERFHHGHRCHRGAVRIGHDSLRE